MRSAAPCFCKYGIICARMKLVPKQVHVWSHVRWPERDPHGTKLMVAFCLHFLSGFVFLFCFVFLAVLGLICCTWAFSNCECGVLSTETGWFPLGWLLSLQSTVFSVVWASTVVVHSITCPAAYGIFLQQGSNQCPLYWQVDS